MDIDRAEIIQGGDVEQEISCANAPPQDSQVVQRESPRRVADMVPTGIAPNVENANVVKDHGAFVMA